MCEQKEQLQSVEKLCHSFTGIHDKAVVDVKKKVTALRALYMSHTEAVQNVVRLNMATSNAGLEEISSLAAFDAHSIEEFFASEACEASSIFNDLQSTLSTHQRELAVLPGNCHRFLVD